MILGCMAVPSKLYLQKHRLGNQKTTSFENLVEKANFSDLPTAADEAPVDRPQAGDDPASLVGLFV